MLPRRFRRGPRKDEGRPCVAVVLGEKCSTSCADFHLLRLPNNQREQMVNNEIDTVERLAVEAKHGRYTFDTCVTVVGRLGWLANPSSDTY